MLRQTFRLGQRSIAQQATCYISQARTFQATARLLSGDKDTGSAPHFSRNLDDKLNYFNKELTATKSEMARLVDKSDMRFASLESEIRHLRSEVKSDMAHLRSEVKSDMAHLRSDMTHLEKNITMEIGSRLDKFENRFLIRMVFAAFVVVGGTVAATILRNPNPAVQTPTTQTPSTQTPTTETPTTETPTTQTPTT
ncbi:hypothetical protein AYL99_01687 [Fonsecaea erecta]|uniref:Uncharacterized protein n=1 Tax=Fonsecaea erecta TaxID=1367422 RepID=A0A179A3I8_9EURO|nr:hypothetical protein AYL99_01687 [Fonsecaea erecta]OAP65715.1 hypothetical protein AYL99_01687 [Fonsecaea erecta]